MAHSLFAATISVTLLLGLAAAHSNLGSPAAYSKQSCKADTSCKTPCPPVRGNRRSVATWRRGETVDIVWHKNNHIGGFYRRSLVPVKHMMDHDWHKKTAFDFGCWGQGTFQCGSNEKLCGGDKKQRAYRNKVTIPSVFPSGEYVFAQVWYGGLQWQARAPKYADYFSCAFVTITGDEPITKSYTAKFQPNPKPKTGFLKGVPLDKCASGSIRTNQCGGDACESGPIMNTVPEEFQGGNSQKVSAALFGNDVPVMEPSEVQEAPAAVVEDTISADIQDKKEDEQVAAEQIAMGEEEPLKELATKKAQQPPALLKETPEVGSESEYLEEIHVIVSGKKVAAIKDGESSTVEYKGGSLKLQIISAVDMKSVVIDVSDRGSQTQRKNPYIYLWKRPEMDKEFKISVQATTRDGKKASMEASVTLSRDGNSDVAGSKSTPVSPITTSTGSESVSEESSQSGEEPSRPSRRSSRKLPGCSKENMPPKPRGSWGRRGSRKFRKMMRMFRKRYNFCRSCPGIC